MKELTPDELMDAAFQSGKINLYKYLIWKQSDRSIESVKKILENNERTIRKT